MSLAPATLSPSWLPRLTRRRRPEVSREPERTGRDPAPGPRTFAVADIHGEITLLRKLIDTLRPAPEDRLVFLGDYIDRGEDSRAVIDYLLELRQAHPCVFLKGNHEDMLLDYLEEESARYGPLVYLLNGGTATLESYGAQDAPELRRKMPAAHLEFFHSLIEHWEDERYIYVHAGVPLGPERPERHSSYLWVREEFIYSRAPFGKKVIFGHTPQRQPLVMENKIGLDTGAYWSGVLTALELPGEVIRQVRR
jgi:serine/threonine protein phosphatase 1